MDPLPPNAYGDAFADVYDRWYSDITDAEATAKFVAERCVRDLPVLELGVGTGRLVGSLLNAGLFVIGVDASVPMLELCHAAHPGTPLVQADLAHFAPAAPIGGAICAFNTLFNLTERGSQQAMISAVARALAPNAPLIIEAVTGHTLANAPETSTGPSLVDPDKTVTSSTSVETSEQRISGVHIEHLDGGQTHNRRWQLRWSTPAQLDEMAKRAGLKLSERHADWDETPYSTQSDMHISVYSQSSTVA